MIIPQKLHEVCNIYIEGLELNNVYLLIKQEALTIKDTNYITLILICKETLLGPWLRECPYTLCDTSFVSKGNGFSLSRHMSVERVSLTYARFQA